MTSEGMNSVDVIRHADFVNDSVSALLCVAVYSNVENRHMARVLSSRFDLASHFLASK